MAANASPPIVFLFRMKLPFLATLSRPSRDAYEVLELPRDASLEEVEQAYHSLSEYWNPRRNALDEAPAHYQAVRQAATELARGLPPKRPARSFRSPSPWFSSTRTPPTPRSASTSRSRLARTPPGFPSASATSPQAGLNRLRAAPG